MIPPSTNGGNASGCRSIISVPHLLQVLNHVQAIDEGDGGQSIKGRGWGTDQMWWMLRTAASLLREFKALLASTNRRASHIIRMKYTRNNELRAQYQQSAQHTAVGLQQHSEHHLWQQIGWPSQLSYKQFHKF